MENFISFGLSAKGAYYHPSQVFVKCILGNSTGKLPDYATSNILQIEDNTISHEGLHYITGYFAYHIQRKHNFRTHTSNMKPEDENAVQFRITCLSRSGIVEPDKECLIYWSSVSNLPWFAASSGIIKDFFNIFES